MKNIKLYEEFFFKKDFSKMKLVPQKPDDDIIIYIINNIIENGIIDNYFTILYKQYRYNILINKGGIKNKDIDPLGEEDWDNNNELKILTIYVDIDKNIITISIRKKDKEDWKFLGDEYYLKHTDIDEKNKIELDVSQKYLNYLIKLFKDKADGIKKLKEIERIEKIKAKKQKAKDDMRKSIFEKNKLKNEKYKII